MGKNWLILPIFCTLLSGCSSELFSGAFPRLVDVQEKESKITPLDERRQIAADLAAEADAIAADIEQAPEPQ